MSTHSLNRRDFGAILGFLVATFAMPSAFAVEGGASALPKDLGASPKLSGWIRVYPDGSVVVFTGKAELGQGIMTALAQIAAEELDVSFGRIQMIGADTTHGPNEAYTYGSQSVEQGGAALRAAAAEARAVLLAAAARELHVSADALTVHDGRVVSSTGGEITYWQLAERGLASLDLNATGKAVPKKPSEYAIVGTSVKRPDIARKVVGDPVYVHDMRPEGMVHGRVVLPPRRGARLVSIDEASARRLPGVLAVVRDGSFLGVIAEREEQAHNARNALQASARWSEDSPRLPDRQHLPEELRRLKSEDSVVVSKGLEQPARTALRRFEQSYSRPYLSHATIGPSCSLAIYRDDHLTVWSHTQGAFPLRGDIATVLKLPPERVDVIHTPGSGCYGHNGADDVSLDAALLARALPGRPVRVQWEREDEFASGPISPAMAMTVRAGVSEAGELVDWDYELWSNTHAMRPGQRGGVNLLSAWHLATPFAPSPPLRIPQPFGDGDRNAVPIYEIPRQRVVNHLLMDMPIRSSSLRTLGALGNVFAIESFTDEIAFALNRDPVAFKKAHLRDARAHAVIDAAVEKAGWVPFKKQLPGHGRGFAYARYKNIQTYAAVVVDVKVDASSGVVNVLKVLAVVDVGRVINPEGVSSQIEGGIIQSVSWVLNEQVMFDDAAVISRSWPTYPILRFKQLPDVEVVIIDRPLEEPLGAGEGALGPTSAAIANAFANATGRRIRDLPMSPERVQASLTQT